MGGTCLAILALTAACGEVSETEADATVTPSIDADPGGPDAPGAIDAIAPVDAETCGASYSCIPAAPVNWNGPVMVYEGPGDTPAPTCPGHWPDESQTVQAALTPQGGCDCACAAATGLSCGSARLYRHGSSNCAATLDPPFTTLSPGQCTSVTVSSSSFYGVSNPATSGGSCAASVVDTLAAPTWAQTVRSCGNDTLAQSSCAAGTVCAPSGDVQYDRVCIWSAGDNACPINSPYNQRVVFHDGYTDDRSCGSCSCGTPSGKCNPNVHYTDSCGSSQILLDVLGPGVCKTINAGSSAYATLSNEPEATCAPSTGTVNGAVTPTGPSTYCCLP